MKIECYCYTRGEQPDYRDFCIPKNVGRKIVSALHNMVSPILEWDLETPRWILYRKQDVIVWGICCRNELLSSSCNVDIKGRAVKVFLAFVCSDIDEDNISLPSFSISPFKELYEKEVAPYWECREGDFHHSQAHSFPVDGIQNISAKKNECFTELNTDVFLCKSLGNGDKNEVVAASLTFPEISLLIDNEDLSEATGKKEPFMNCLSSSIARKTVKVKRTCPQCLKYVGAFTENGICTECEKANTPIEEDVIYTKPNDMERTELEQLRRNLKYCELNNAQIENRLSKATRMNKILWIICGIFFLAIVYLWSNLKDGTSISGNRKESVPDTIVKTIEKPYKFEILNRAFEIPADGKESVMITWKSDLPQMKTIVDDSWIEVISENSNSITINVKKNGTDAARETQIGFILGEQKEVVQIKQNKK